MNKTEKRLVPELRFPEFLKDDEWEEKTLQNICNITNGKANAQDHIENGNYPLFDRSEVIKSTDNFIFDCEAVIIPGEGVRFVPKYYEGKFNLHQRAYALKDFNSYGKFVYFSMLHKSNLLSKKAVQSTVLSLRLPILQTFPIEIPKKPNEQQKIADCLSSLDEAITAHADKLDNLKKHKKGLLQNLFPQEEETVPKLRFKEFEKDGEWNKDKLDNLAKTINEKVGSRKFTLISIDAGVGLVSQIEKFGREIAGNSYSNYIVINRDDFAFNKKLNKVFPEGQISILNNYDSGAVRIVFLHVSDLIQKLSILIMLNTCLKIIFTENG